MTRARTIRAGLAVVLPLLLVMGVVWAAAPGPAVDWEVISGGGGPSGGGEVTLNGTLGQTAIGPSAGGGGVTLGAGFWYGIGGQVYRVYLPVVVRSAP